MKGCKVISHTMTIEYVCPTNEQTYTLEISEPSIREGKYYEDWSYTYVRFHCPHCGKEHSFEI
jgi:hypothetical protein